MEIRQLQYFLEVCRCNSFAGAAEACFITAQGMSMSIGRLEDELGVSLFHRTPRGLMPTEDGEYLMRRAGRVMELVRECEEYFAERSVGRLTISAMFVRGTVEKFAHTAFGPFKERYPDVSARIRVGEDAQCETALSNGEIDFAVCAGPVPPNLEATLLYSGRNVLAVNHRHPLAAKQAISVQDLRGLPLALQHKTTRSTSTLFSLCRGAGFEPSVFNYVDDLRLAVYLTDLNQSCAVMNPITARKLVTDKLRVIPFETAEMDWNIFLIKHKNAKQSQEARLFEKIVLGLREA